MAKVLDNILCSIMVFLLTFAWTVYCLKNLQLALILATIVTLAASYIIYTLLKRAETKRETKKQRKKTLENFAMYLQFNSDNSALFMQLFCYYKFISTIIDFDNIIISKAEETDHHCTTRAKTDKRTFVAICFQAEYVTLAQIQSAIVTAKRQNCQNIMIFGNKINSSLLTLANAQIPTKFVDTANAYELFEHAEKLPQMPNCTTPKQHFIPQFAFNKKRFLWYFFGAIYNLVLSFFSYFKLYLLVWATVMFCLAVYSVANKRYNQPPTNVKLE